MHQENSACHICTRGVPQNTFGPYALFLPIDTVRLIYSFRSPHRPACFAPEYLFYGLLSVKLAAILMLLVLASVCSSCSFPVDSDLVLWKVKELFGSFLVLLIQFYILCDVYNASKIERCVRWYKEVICYAICLRKNCIHCENINVKKIFYGNSSIHAYQSIWFELLKISTIFSSGRRKSFSSTVDRVKMFPVTRKFYVEFWIVT